MNAAYTDTIRRWATDDRRAGILADADGIGEVGLGEGEAGRRLAVRFALCVRGSRIETVRYQVFGCGFTIAACAAAAELAEGHTLNEVAVITPTWVDATLAGLPADRDYCARLAVEALQAAVKSVRGSRRPVAATIAMAEDHPPRVTTADPVYRLLVDSPAPPGAPPEDRHLFACLLAIAAAERHDTAAALDLDREELAELLHRYFPGIEPERLTSPSAPAAGIRPQTNVAILDLLLTYLPRDADDRIPTPSLWLARILATRAARSGHLWLAMGLSARPELTAAIHRHLPSLAAANHQGMRWKRFFYRQVCEQDGGVMCKTPDCRGCSDYALCFAAG
ncbi:MAG: hydrogenase [Desulfuromonas sp.]|nr:hydrogenase [Desulfuromonas sp.]